MKLFPQFYELCFRNEVKNTRKQVKAQKQTGTKILVRNIPFQAHKKEIQELFRCQKIYLVYFYS